MTSPSSYLFNVGSNSPLPKHEGLLLKIKDSFTEMDLKFIKFMLEHLPSTNREEATRLLLDVSRIFEERTIFSNRDNPSRIAHLNRVPAELRLQLAQELLKSLKDTHEGLLSHLELYIRDTSIDTWFCDVFNSWFYSNVLGPEIANGKATMSSVDSRFTELFGTLLRKTSGRKGSSSIRFFYKDSIASFAAISEAYVHGTVEDVFTNLDALVVADRPEGKESGCDAISDEGYIDEYDNWNWIYGKIYLLDDILDIIEKGANIVDTHLTKLGREKTPENRVLFLSLSPNARTLKSTWKYYDWGVTDPKRIIALKRGKISKKSDVQTYNELPDGMFYELVALESGDNSTIILFVDESELLTQLK